MNTVKHKSVTYKCHGHGLSTDDNFFVDDLTPFLARLKKDGTPKKYQPKLRQKSISWWRAQCAFRGLPQKGNVEQLEMSLRTSRPMLPELIELEKKAIADWKVQQAQAEEKEIARCKALQEEATAKAKEDLLRGFPVGARKTHGRSVLVKSDDPVSYQEAARQLGLHADTTTAPADGSSEWNTGIYEWTVIGTTQELVARHITKIQKERAALKRKLEEEFEEAERQAEAEKIEKVKQLKKKVSASTSSKVWDVTGTWKIHCPYIEEQWSSYQDLELEIHIEQTKKGRQMYAKFDFRAVTGVFRFEGQSDTGSRQKESGGGKKRKYKEDSNEEDEVDEEYKVDEEDEYGERNRRSPTPEAFHMSLNDVPSSKNKTWNYRWRGEETGENCILLGSDAMVYDITFDGPKCTELVGTFGGGVVGECEFTGVKVGMKLSPIDISDEWANRSRGAFEEARVKRWRR